MSAKKESPDVTNKLKAAASAQAQAVGGAAADHAKLVASDLFQALKTDWRFQVLMVLLIISVLGWHAPYISTILYPFKLFTTIIHEACHALAARFTGGNVAIIQINPDEAGVTSTIGGYEPFVTSAGYLGASMFGALLIWLGRTPETAKTVLQSIGIVILSLTIFYGGGSIFSFLTMLAIGAVLLLVSQKCSTRVCHGLLLMLAVQTTLQASFQIQYLLYQSANSMGVMSDALHMEKLTGVPSLVWTISWAIISVVLFVYAFWISYRPSKKPVAATAAATETASNSDVVAAIGEGSATAVPDSTIDVSNVGVKQNER